MILQSERFREHFARGRHRAGRDGVLVHGLFEFCCGAKLRDCVRAVAAGLRDPSGHFAALNLDLIRPIGVVPFGRGIAQ